MKNILKKLVVAFLGFILNRMYDALDYQKKVEGLKL